MRAPATAAAAALALLLALQLAGRAAAAQAACAIPMRVAPSSNVAVGGAITTPFNAAVNAANRAPFSGAFAVVIPGACPASEAALKAALPKAYLATPAGARGVAIGSANANVVLGSTNAATLTVQGLSGTVASAPGPAGVAAPTLTATGGSVVTRSPLMAVRPVALKGRALNVGGGCALSAAGASVLYSCPKLKVNDKFTLANAGSGTLNISGAIAAVGKLSDAKALPAGSVPAPLQG